ncbi:MULTISPECIES: hypothetical protein [Staphylococcus]|uniref:Uncharacterized protein n=1 Tax=Staphylococcus hsinchuensis TaxID=3051183 RepID=A0ABZ3EED4_9STAP|nr:hypothetical protein [Staphylococcus sp. Marseille-Q6910]
MLFKLFLNSLMADQAKSSYKELKALYNDFKELNEGSAMTTNNLDELFKANQELEEK